MTEEKPKKLGRVGLVGRFKPVHNGAAVMLESICEQADHVVIGLGSCNKYNMRNAFTADESQAMIEAFLSQRFTNYSFVHVPDSGHIPEHRDGKKWKEFIKSNYGNIDHFVSGNDYVRSLLEKDYKMVQPGSLVPEEKWVYLRATEVRVEMAKGDDWKQLVPDAVAEYLEKNKLVERFREEGRVRPGDTGQTA
jgi:nicotinamide-nucleotide adenylyltransferase